MKDPEIDVQKMMVYGVKYVYISLERSHMKVNGDLIILMLLVALLLALHGVGLIAYLISAFLLAMALILLLEICIEVSTPYMVRSLIYVIENVPCIGRALRGSRK